jgi:hypothetical protein
MDAGEKNGGNWSLPRREAKCILGCEYQGLLVRSRLLCGPNLLIVDAECAD